ncbi:MAG TPA: hypothetical protein VJ654_13245 [Noviherbaspirillum sp.]|nr:hypothetical protein [Noviherbaspirillum sp.]
MEEKNYLFWLSIDDGKPVKFAELAHMMAKAMHPSDDELMRYAVARRNLEEELPQAVQRGELVVRNPSGLGQHSFPFGQALQDSVILPQDLSPFLGARSIGLRIVKKQPNARTPDWEYWRAMRKAKEWQACALSLDIDPGSMKDHPQAWMEGPDSGPLFTSDSFPSNDVQVKFEKRLEILRANRSNRTIFTQSTAKHSGLLWDEVSLSEFAAWGLSIHWNDMPPELVAIAKPVSLPSPTRPQSAQPSPAISAEEWDTLIEQEEEARKDPAYKAKYDHAMSLYDERDRLLEYLRQDHPYVDIEIKKRLSEIRKQIAESESGLGDVPLSVASTKENKSPTPRTRTEPQGGDSLTPTIWTICYNLQEAGKKVTARPVMGELKRMAAEKIHPLISTTAGGVKYEYEKGDEQELTSSQLDKRIQEWRKIGG